MFAFVHPVWWLGRLPTRSGGKRLGAHAHPMIDAHPFCALLSHLRRSRKRSQGQIQVVEDHQDLFGQDGVRRLSRTTACPLRFIRSGAWPTGLDSRSLGPRHTALAPLARVKATL